MYSEQACIYIVHEHAYSMYHFTVRVLSLQVWNRLKALHDYDSNKKSKKNTETICKF